MLQTSHAPTVHPLPFYPHPVGIHFLWASTSHGHPLPVGIHYPWASITCGHPPPVGNTGNQTQALREKHWLRGTDTMRTKKEKARMKKTEKEFLPAPLDHQTRVRGTHPKLGCEERIPTGGAAARNAHHRKLSKLSSLTIIISHIDKGI